MGNKWANSVFDTLDSFLAWLSSSLRMTTATYCDLETAESEYNLVTHDGSLVSVIRIEGVTYLMGSEEFSRAHEGITMAFQANMRRLGHAFQFFFLYDKEQVKDEIQEILEPANETAKRLELSLDDLFSERVNYLSKFCGTEKLYLVLWTKPYVLNEEQRKHAFAEKGKALRKNKIPPLKNAQNIMASIPDIREEHESFVSSIMNDFGSLSINVNLLDVHEALHEIREIIDSNFTDNAWRPVLPGDKIPVRDVKTTAGGDISGLLWPPLSRQILPRDAENLDLRTCRVGDRIYSAVFVDLFPQELKPFFHLYNRVLSSNIPWRVSFWVESGGLSTIRFKSLIATILSFASAQNRLLANATELLQNIEVNTDDAIVKLRVTLATWAPEGDTRLLRNRTASLAKAVQGWGTCEVSEVCGDAFAGIVSSMMGVTNKSVATSSVAPLKDVIYMLPFTRPASPWKQGAVLFRSPDGKAWAYQPGSSQQTTWIDLMYARPGSGKSVLSNTINLGLCLAAGIQRLPRIAIVDIGPSSSGLISLLHDALPKEQQHYVAYHRLRMTPEYSINPFNTQLGCRYPLPHERSFLVNFLTLLATPLGALKPYDGVSDMAGLITDELYKNFADDGAPRTYTTGIENVVDGVLEEIGFVRDEHTTWWEVTDALFMAGFIHEATLAQRYAMPLMADAVSICRVQAIEDLYGQVKAPTGEPLTVTFSRMLSSAIREYPILSRITKFDLGEAKVVSLDLAEVAKSGGDAADRQTAVMYMIARYVLAKDFYLTDGIIEDVPQQYQSYHRQRVGELTEDPKRLVYDEFHRTSKAQSVRDQVIVDMREGRKANVQVALISQSLDDFDSVMVEFATSIFIMDAGPAQAIKHSAEVFGLSETAQFALRTRVHGPREGGATFLAQFSTKHGLNTQLLTNTLGPVELWAFSTTTEDASMRDKLYQTLGPAEARRILANVFSGGSIKGLVEKRMAAIKEEKGLIEDVDPSSIVDQLIKELLDAYAKNPDVKHLA